jgi:hypothetical protein
VRTAKGEARIWGQYRGTRDPREECVRAEGRRDLGAKVEEACTYLRSLSSSPLADVAGSLSMPAAALSLARLRSLLLFLGRGLHLSQNGSPVSITGWRAVFRDSHPNLHMGQ